MAEEVQAAIRAMPPGSAAGLDGVWPMHLQRLTSKKTAEAGRHLIHALTAYVTVLQLGKSQTIHLAGKLVTQQMSRAVAAELQPLQLGVGRPLGCEAAVHAVREFTTTHDGNHEHIIVKVDMANAFNSISKKAVLEEVIRRFPAAMPLMSQAYSQPTPLQLSRFRRWSQWGVQQGDPMGPLLFAFAINPVIRSLTSPYMSGSWTMLHLQAQVNLSCPTSISSSPLFKRLTSFFCDAPTQVLDEVGKVLARDAGSLDHQG
ncbi:hypothetical protein Pcinc_027098 [Petrolisthes cinctipes]|uniref:Reverse transcriptase n=1 Tax=Petrolisthes cinctipes TaxID=88211 RepID=A0AAE1F5M4_PETCI|nr:hypothetical protein Pcinc_027098 [Petrolisthes cinctipes]